MSDYHKKQRRIIELELEIHLHLCSKQTLREKLNEAEQELTRVRDDNHKQWRRSIKLENDIMNDKSHLDFVAHDYQKKIDELKRKVKILQGSQIAAIDALKDCERVGCTEETVIWIRLNDALGAVISAHKQGE